MKKRFSVFLGILSAVLAAGSSAVCGVPPASGVPAPKQDRMVTYYSFNGNTTALAKGEATIMVTYKELVEYFTITVN